MDRLDDLVAYRLAAELGDVVFATTRGWPSFERWTIGVQLARAALSIGANIAESRGRRHDPDGRRFLLIARGSLLETRHWLMRAQAAGLIEAPPSTEELSKTLNGLIKSLTHDA